MLTEERFKAILKAEREAILASIDSLLNSRRSLGDRSLSAKEAATLLGISLSTLYKNVAYLPHKKFGKKLVFSQAALLQFDFASIAERKAKVD